MSVSLPDMGILGPGVNVRKYQGTFIFQNLYPVCISDPSTFYVTTSLDLDPRLPD